MMFQFLSGRWSLGASTPSGVPDKVESTWAAEHSLDQDFGVHSSQEYATTERSATPLPLPGACCVVRACAEFHDAHRALAAAADSGIESDLELRARRDGAFKHVRLLSARTKDALLAKKRVLDVMCDWFSVEDPEVAAFSFELVTEAIALLHNDPAQGCSCHHSHGAAPLIEGRSAEWRNPLSWFIRQRGETTEAPFAN